MTRTVRPFTVEFSRSRKRKVKTERPDDTIPSQPAHPVLRPPASGGAPSESSMGEARRLAEAVFGGPRNAPPPGEPAAPIIANEPAMERPAPAMQQRVLPDLLAEDPVAVLLRQREAEEAARRRRPVVPRPDPSAEAPPKWAVSADVVPSGPSKPPARPAIRKVPVASVGQAAAQPPAALPAAHKSQSNAATPGESEKPAAQKPVSRLASRRAERLGLTERFLPGERWKRRLPKICR
jgi:hypothetical protein